MGHLLDFLIALVGGLGGAALYTRIPHFRLRERRGTDGHEHQFTRMVGDGKGWRCGTCNRPRSKV